MINWEEFAGRQRIHENLRPQLKWHSPGWSEEALVRLYGASKCFPLAQKLIDLDIETRYGTFLLRYDG